MADCIFCKIVAGDVPCHRVYEDEATLAFLDVAPTNPGHTLLVPKAHYPDLLATPADVVAALVEALPRVARAVRAGSGADAFNVGINNGAAAGQVVFHTHLHVIPRFANDGYRSWGHKQYAPGEAEAVAERIRRAVGTAAA
jgi:histidine triad (HIT) family protein